MRENDEQNGDSIHASTAHTHNKRRTLVEFSVGHEILYACARLTAERFFPAFGVAQRA